MIAPVKPCEHRYIPLKTVPAGKNANEIRSEITSSRRRIITWLFEQRHGKKNKKKSKNKNVITKGNTEYGL
jgi:hypothetical protein